MLCRSRFLAKSSTTSVRATGAVSDGQNRLGLRLRARVRWLMRWGLPQLHEHPAVPKFRRLSPNALNGLPRRTSSRRGLKTLERYRSYIRDMLGNSDGSKSALELTRDEVKRVATLKRWLRKAASAEGVNISVE